MPTSSGVRTSAPPSSPTALLRELSRGWSFSDRAPRAPRQRGALRRRRVAARADGGAAVSGPPEPPRGGHRHREPGALPGVRLQRLLQDERGALRVALSRRQGRRHQAGGAALRAARARPRTRSSFRASCSRLTGSRKRMLVASLFMWPMVHNWFVSMGMLDFALAVPLSLGLLLAIDRQRRAPALVQRALRHRASARDLVRARLPAARRAHARLHRGGAFAPSWKERVDFAPRDGAAAAAGDGARRSSRSSITCATTSARCRRSCTRTSSSAVGARLQPVGGVVLGLHEALDHEHRAVPAARVLSASPRRRRQSPRVLLARGVGRARSSCSASRRTASRTGSTSIRGSSRTLGRAAAASCPTQLPKPRRRAARRLRPSCTAREWAPTSSGSSAIASSSPRASRPFPRARSSCRSCSAQGRERQHADAPPRVGLLRHRASTRARRCSSRTRGRSRSRTRRRRRSRFNDLVLENFAATMITSANFCERTSPSSPATARPSTARAGRSSGTTRRRSTITSCSGSPRRRRSISSRPITASRSGRTVS